MGIFQLIAEKLAKTKQAIGNKLFELFNKKVINDEFFEEMENCLISADVGVTTSVEIVEQLREEVINNRVKDPAVIKDMLRDFILERIDYEISPLQYPTVILMTGVNGTGKTTTVGKLAHKFKKQGLKVMMAAADTFRAAAAEQLCVWGDRAGVRVIKHEEGADPAAVVYDAIQSAKAHDIDILLVDTAGRLQNKKNLMSELGKIYRVIGREWAEADVRSYIVVDATVGQNAVSQIEAFDECVDIDGIVLTKLDGTAKGGVVIAICGERDVPIVHVGVGEGIDDIEDFDAESFVDAIL
ncbi:MAG: signal recognition particle-docking protein FtsY [Clostridia bacterium]|nr:signal recognition particle-docking protein FtsY [Clostridia bacterium]